MTSLVLAAALSRSPVERPGFDVPPADHRLWQLQDAQRVREEAVKQAAARTPTDASVHALLQLQRVDEALDAVMRIVNERPRDGAGALLALGSGAQQFSDGTRDYSAKLNAIFAAAREQAAHLSREDAAVLEFALVDAEGLVHPGSGAWRDRTADVAARYEATHAAALASIRLLTFTDMTQRLAGLDAIVAAHPGTDVAGAALYQKGADLAHNAFVTGPDRQLDPTERFMRVLAISRELESGRYPAGAWTEKAASLVVEFSAYKPEYSPEHLDAVIDAYRAFLKTHFSLDTVNLFGNGSGYLITSKIAELFKLKGDPQGVERLMRELEADSADRQGAAYLHAAWLPAGSDRAARLQAIASDEGNPCAPKALATLALDELQAGHGAAARAVFQRFVERYPRSEYAWMASLHAAEALALEGDWAAAERELTSAAATYSRTTMAVVLGGVLAAHAAEASGQSARAADHYAAALAVWDRGSYQVSLFTSRDSPVFWRADVVQRTARLRASLARPGGDLLERGRWQLAHGQREAAVKTLEDAMTRFPRSPVRADALLLLHRAQLEAALDLANVERPGGGDAAAAALSLDALSRQPGDSAVVAARIARASQLWSRGRAAEARAAMTAALEGWIQAQPHQSPDGDIERDVVAVRDAVFRPLGDGIFAGRARWNAFTWPDALPRFLLMDPEITVKLPSGDETAVVVTSPLPGLPQVIFSDKTLLDLLSRTIESLGGTKRRQPAAVMETPNQPVGESMNILALWNEYFPTRPGHWGGFEFTSYPRLTRVEFLDPARTRAAVKVTIGYSGCTVVLEKRGDVWTPVRLTNEWIT